MFIFNVSKYVFTTRVSFYDVLRSYYDCHGKLSGTQLAISVRHPVRAIFIVECAIIVLLSNTHNMDAINTFL